jgi:hypothetical protein
MAPQIIRALPSLTAVANHPPSIPKGNDGGALVDATMLAIKGLVAADANKPALTLTPTHPIDHVAPLSTTARS